MENENTFNFATFGQRFKARLIDTVFIGLSTVIIVIFINLLCHSMDADSNDNYYSVYFLIMPQVLFWLLYYPIMEARGGTFGKRLVGLKTLERISLTNITIINSYRRMIFQNWAVCVMLILTIVTFTKSVNFELTNTMTFLIIMELIFTIISPLSMLWNKDNSTWYDQWTSTYIINKKKIINNINLQENNTETSKIIIQKKKNSYKGWGIFLFVVLFLTLPFHYVPSRMMVFPKSNLTFSYTFITEEDITNIINRYNNASLLEKTYINNEPIIRKLREQGILIDTTFNFNNNNLNKNK
ncbi:MAG: RDD family protein [Bacteroidota bacterium]